MSEASPRLLTRSEAARLGAAAGFLAVAFPPLPFGLVVLAALGPLLAVLDDDPRPGFRRGFLRGAFFGSLFYLVLLFWLWDLIRFTPLIVPSWLLASLYLGSLVGLAAAATQWLRARTGRSAALFLPFTWLVLEKLLQYGDLRFTWGVLANAITPYPLLLQTGELWGAPGLSFLVVSVNALGYAAWRARSDPTRRLQAVLALGLLAGLVLAYGIVRWNAYAPGGESPPGVVAAQAGDGVGDSGRERSQTVRVAVIQPDIPQDARDDPARADVEKRRLFELSELALASEPDLVVWPETAASWLRYDPRYLDDLTDLCCRSGREATSFLVGGLDAEDAGTPDQRIFNAAFLLASSGEITGIYRKVLLVPMTEQVPYASLLGILKPERWSGSFSAGEDFMPLAFEADSPGYAGNVAVGVPICYEITFPQAIRGFRTAGARLIATITNDAWFGRTAAPYQHFAQLRLRAVEDRVAIARAANTGISGFVGPRGDVLAKTGIFEAGYLVADLPLAGGLTPYAGWGDWIVPAAWLGLGVYLAVEKVGRRRKREPGLAARAAVRESPEQPVARPSHRT